VAVDYLCRQIHDRVWRKKENGKCFVCGSKYPFHFMDMMITTTTFYGRNQPDFRSRSMILVHSNNWPAGLFIPSLSRLWPSLLVSQIVVLVILVHLFMRPALLFGICSKEKRRFHKSNQNQNQISSINSSR